MSDFFAQYEDITLPVQRIQDSCLASAGITLDIKRLDEIHPEVSGNKFFKLKYNMREAVKQRHSQIITFGGAHSNHIAATAFAAERMGLTSVAVIRGDELLKPYLHNQTELFVSYPTLKFAHEHGMRFEFVSREDYRLKDDDAYLASLSQRLGGGFFIPEGGTNALAVQGCADMLSADGVDNYDVVAVAVGTGGTLAGISKALTAKEATTLGIAVVKDASLHEAINTLTKPTKTRKPRNWQLNFDYTLGGYAKVDAQLVDFINAFYAKHGIPLEPIYTGKLVFALYDLIKKGYFPGSTRILALHTGGLQGVSAMQAKLKKLRLPKLEVF